MGPGPLAQLPAITAVAAIAVRPAYLFLIPWLVVAGTLLSRRCGIGWMAAFKTAAITGLVVIVPVVAWMGVRYSLVGDFAVAPFGHQNLGGVLVQLVSDDELNELGELGRAVATRKRAYLSTMGQSSNDHPQATMTIDARWDAMTYFVVMTAAEAETDGDLIDSHRAIRDLNRRIIIQWPDRYLIWLAKAIRRGAWAIAADLVMHPVFLPLITLAMALILYRAVMGEAFIGASDRSPAVDALTILAISYLVAKLGFVAMSSPPIGRFSDAAGIFLPSLLAAGFVRWYGR